MKIHSLLRLKINAAQASSKEPVGPALGQLGIPIMDFCTKFNNSTLKYIADTPLNVIIYSYGNQKYDFIIKYPDFNFFIKKCFFSYNYIPIKNPGYIQYPYERFFYLTPYLLYEVLLYNAIGNNRFFVTNEYKRFVNSLKSNGFVIFSN